MSETRESFDRLIENLKRERDELRVQLNLAKREIKDEWDALEEKWEALEPKLVAFGHEAKSASHQVGEAAELFAEEIADAYRKLRKTLR